MFDEDLFKPICNTVYGPIVIIIQISIAFMRPYRRFAIRSSSTGVNGQQQAMRARSLMIEFAEKSAQHRTYNNMLGITATSINYCCHACMPTI